MAARETGSRDLYEVPLNEIVARCGYGFERGNGQPDPDLNYRFYTFFIHVL